MAKATNMKTSSPASTTATTASTARKPVPTDLSTPHSIAPWIRFDPKLWFDPAKGKGCRARPKDATTNKHVGHWTGGNDRWVGADETSASRVFRALQTRVDSNGRPEPLSIHFVIEADGDVWQMAALGTRAYHAGAVNDDSIGTEITNPAFRNSRMTVSRPMEKHIVHGGKVEHYAFTEKQLASWVRLNEELADQGYIERVVPGIVVGHEADGTPIFDVASDRLSKRNVEAFSGAGEHLHFSSKKVDAGTALCRALVASGWGYWPIDSALRR